ncbi:hypothetical protein ACFORO_06775 [Amycolatopsis halotolerans]|uniref:Uncharacterized protein n=1 Tax=Amycolatopsis halotolerans TaxID=330083 RepID=A0ABV7Q9A9_9PSEU
MPSFRRLPLRREEHVDRPHRTFDSAAFRLGPVSQHPAIDTTTDDPTPAAAHPSTTHGWAPASTAACAPAQTSAKNNGPGGPSRNASTTYVASTATVETTSTETGPGGTTVPTEAPNAAAASNPAPAVATTPARTR